MFGDLVAVVAEYYDAAVIRDVVIERYARHSFDDYDIHRVMISMKALLDLEFASADGLNDAHPEVKLADVRVRESVGMPRRPIRRDAR